MTDYSRGFISSSEVHPWTHQMVHMCFSAGPQTPQRQERDIKQDGEKNERGNANVDNSIYIIPSECELRGFEECCSWRLSAEKVHNSIETWLHLLVLPFSCHPSKEYFMCRHLPATVWSRSDVCFLSRRFPVPPAADLSPDKSSHICSLSLDIGFFEILPGCIIGRTLDLHHFGLVLISMANLMMDSVEKP